MEEHTPFYMRVKDNMVVFIGQKKFKTSAQLFLTLPLINSKYLA
jgi:hypothetical protein